MKTEKLFARLDQLKLEHRELDHRIGKDYNLRHDVSELKVQKLTVEGRHRLKKWCTLGKGKNAGWVHKGATDAIAFVESGQDLKLSYDFDWIKKYFEEKYG